jgi:hypothetical protein
MAGGVITTGAHPKLLWPGIKATWGQIYDEHPFEYPDLYDVESSSRAWEEDVQITPFGLAQYKAEGATGYFDYETQGPVTRYTHLAYFLGYKVTYEELSDNLYEIVSSRRAKANAFSMVQTIENVSVVPYNDAFSGTFYTGGDGVSLCNTAHPNTTGGTYSNALTPGADLSEAALEDMVILIMGVQNDRGLLVSIMPTSLHIPRQEWFNAHRILKSVLQADTALNNINVLKATNAFPGGIKMNHYFTAAHAWFVRTNCPEGMKYYWREQPGFAQDNDFDTMNLKARSYMRLSVGNTDPRAVFGSNGP